MSTVMPILAKYVAAIDQLSAKAMGGSTGQATIGPEPGTQLRVDLEHQRDGNNRILWGVVILLYALFSVGVGLIIMYRQSPTTIGVLFGGTFLSLVGVVWKLRELWLDKSLMDLLIFSADRLQPDELARLVTAFYFARTRRWSAEESQILAIPSPQDPP